MFSNILPFVCSNINEFNDERVYLREKTFPKLKAELEKLNINFDPVEIKWNEQDDYVKSGNILRLLLHSIQQSSPFFICLLGQQYGSYLEKDKVKSNYMLDGFNVSDMNWIEKNLLVASQTGYNHIINSVTYYNSFLEFQISTALYDTNNYPFYRFYYRQAEYLDEKFAHLPIEDRKKAIAAYGPENDNCDFKIKDLKMKIAKKGLVVKYYKTIEQLDQFIYEDFIEMIKAFLSINIDSNKSKPLWKIENLIYCKLNKYILTDSIQDLINKLDLFCRTKSRQNVHFKLELPNGGQNDQMDLLNSSSLEELNQTEEYLEILKLRHINLSNYMTTNSKNSKSAPKQIFLITGPRGKGKTSFMLQVYQNVNVSQFSSSFDQNSQTGSSSIVSNSDLISKTNNKESKPLYLFYFLKPQDSLISILIDITLKMRLHFTQKDSATSINNEIHDLKSIVEQFHASLNLGASVIFIDGLSEIDTKKTIKLSSWLPTKLETDSKFVITLTKSSEYYSELVARKSCVTHDLNVFKTDNDYRNLFYRLLGLSHGSSSTEINNLTSSNNALYAKFLSLFNELKTANHFSSPLFIQLIAQEIFSFDREIYKTHPVHVGAVPVDSLDRDLVRGRDIVSLSEYSDSASTSLSQNSQSVNIINSYIEEVATLREIIQKIIKRYIKKHNWSTNLSVPLSIENSGWIGDTLCLIALSKHGITKSAILRILQMRGYTKNLERFKLENISYDFWIFLMDGVNGVLLFSHQYIREAVQTLLLDGFSVTVDQQSELSLLPSKQNISEKQKQMHLLLILDILKFRIDKSEFDFSCQIENKNKIDNVDLSQKYLELLHELIYHVYMIYDLVNLCKLLTNFKVLHIFYENRMKYINEWFDFCNYLKMTTNLETLRPIMMSSFTIGIPQFIFEIRDEKLTFSKINLDDIKDYVKRVDYSNVKKVQSKLGKSNLIKEIFQIGENKNLEKQKSLLQLKPIKKKTSQNFSSSSPSISPRLCDIQLPPPTAPAQAASSQPPAPILKKSQNFYLQNYSEIYEFFIESLLDLTDVIDLSDNDYGDSFKLILINRALILNDLMRHLDDQFFLENYSFSLFKLVDTIITQNYPLNGTEKLKYSFVLQELAIMSIQTNRFEAGFKYAIKAIELIEDLIATFHIIEIDEKLKNKMQLLQLSNRLSFLHSKLAFLFLKMNNLNSATLLLSKAFDYITESVSGLSNNLELDKKINEAVAKHELKSKENKDKKQLIYRQSLKSALASATKNESLNDDAGSYEAKYHYYFISALLQVQQANYSSAKRFFQLALNLSRKWYGMHHLNASRVYHYYGCFYSLSDMEYYNTRKAELFLRKALYIREKDKEKPNEFKLRNNFLTASNASIQLAQENFILNVNDPSNASARSLENYYSSSSTTTTPKSSNYQMNSEERNNVAAILYDLGCLLATYESNISRREAIDCLRRSLDIKVLVLGATHPDCLIIKKKLSDISLENAQSLTSISRQQLTRKDNNSDLVSGGSRCTSSLFRSPSSMKSLTEQSPKTEIEKFLNELKQTKSDSSSKCDDQMDAWIKKNSIIHLIPSKLDKDLNIESLRSKTSRHELQKSQEKIVILNQFERSYVQDDDVTQGSTLVDQTILNDSNNNNNNNYYQLPQPHTSIINLPDESSTLLALNVATNEKQQRINRSYSNLIKTNETTLTAKLPKSTSMSQLGLFSNNTNNNRSKESGSFHIRNCKCPTALSIDIHNSKTINGPNSSLQALLNVDNLEASKNDYEKSKTNSSTYYGLLKHTPSSNLRHRVLKHVYYKSAWYIPSGSNGRRFKSFIKVTPNA